MQEEFEDQGAAEAAAFDFEVGKAGGKVGIFYVADAYEGGIFHGGRETVAGRGADGGTVVIGGFLAQVFAAYAFVAGFPCAAGDRAAFVAEEFYFIF